MCKKICHTFLLRQHHSGGELWELANSLSDSLGGQTFPQYGDLNSDLPVCIFLHIQMVTGLENHNGESKVSTLHSSSDAAISSSPSLFHGSRSTDDNDIQGRLCLGTRWACPQYMSWYDLIWTFRSGHSNRPTVLLWQTRERTRTRAMNQLGGSCHLWAR